MDMPATEYAVALPKTENAKALKAQIDAFIDTQTQNGWLAELEEKWLSASEPTETIDFSQLTGENGTLRLAATVESKPFDYLKNGQFFGLDAEFIYHFAKEYGYSLEIDIIDFGGLLPGLAVDRYDLAVSSITVTEERKESVLFSKPYCRSPIIMAFFSDDEISDSRQSLTDYSVMTLADIENATLGIVTGTSWDIVAQKRFPNAERKYFKGYADLPIALEQGKIDAYFADKTVFAGMRWENSSITYIDEPVETVTNALIFAKNGYDEKLLAQVNEFIAKCKENGTLDRLSEKWLGESEPKEHPDYTKLTGENGTLRIAIGDGMKPMAYQIGELFTGYEADFLTLFAEEYGYKLDMQGMAFDALIPSVASGKCDIGACGITITPERMESVTFSNPHIETYGVAVIRNNDNNRDEKTQQIRSVEDLAGRSVAVLTGTIWDGIAKEKFPNTEIKYFTGITDMTLALDQRKVDAILGDETFYITARWEDKPVTVLEETIGTVYCGLILSKDNYDATLLAQLNAFIAQSRTDGTIDKLSEKWLADTEPAEHPDYSNLSGENGTLKIAVENAARPMTYQKNSGFTGFDVELLTMFAKQYGYRLEFSGMAFDALIPTVSSGKCDIGVCGIAITEERAESVTFTECYVEISGVVVVREAEESAAQSSFWSNVAESFQKTFVREDRWKLIIDGIGITMLISISAATLGSLCGFGLYMLSRSDVKVIRAMSRGFAKGYSRVIAGTPVVVILMILFYVVFGKVRDMSGVIVAIIGFTLTFGSFVYDHMTVSVGSVDRGQIEAAYALGYTKNKTFFRIVFPQAMSIFLPSYCGQAVELIKATAVVGYIAVNDLTKMGDIIRSNTYEAFFPLIATAIIYFILTWILSLLLGFVKLRFEPQRRSKEDILKGVKTK
jgi:polar amino acid transport system substrate-binding protein